MTEDWSEDESAFVEKLIGSKTEELENRHKLGLTNSGVTAKLSNLVSWLCFLLYIWKCTNMISDNAFGVLLGFIYKVFSLISNDDKVLASVIMLFPTSVYCIRKFMNINRDEFERFVVCPSCTKIYLLKDCFQNQSCRIPKLTHCNQKHYRTKSSYKVCNEPLFRRVSLRNGQHAHYPYKIYCYSYISTRLESLLQRKGYEDMCSKWKKRESRSDLMFDVYDGEVWKSFQNFKGTAFLAADNTYGLQLNVDWFQPYTRRNDISVGVIYMVLLNLPLSVRFKKENMIIVGVIPSLSKEPSCLNNFLDPMVDELKRLWKGVSMSTSKYPHGVQVRCAVVCFAADVPAARKLCGFMGHSAARGCSKCLKVFPGGFGEKTNYSGFNKQLWPLRLYDCHVTAVRQINNCYSKTARAKKESELGWRYTSLMKLEYFNSVTHHVIDPMHNLFLGTAKRMFKLWIDNCILTQDNLAEIDRKIRNFKLGGDMGRLPSNIASNWGGFTAEQWKNWTLIYSLYVLNGILPDRHYKCWHTFVTACLKLVSPIVRMTDARIADHLFIKFGTEVESLYGKTVITPNMHLHCHLYESVLNYGPVYTFWLFAFERYNGILGDFNTNRRDNIEIQLMREFLTTITLLDRCFGLKQDVHSDILLPIALDVSSTRSSQKTIIEPIVRWQYSQAPVNSTSDWTVSGMIDFGGKNRVQKQIDSDDLDILRHIYSILYPNLSIGDLAKTIHKFQSIRCNDTFFSTRDSGSNNCSVVYAKYIDSNGHIDVDSTSYAPGKLKEIFTHNAIINGEKRKHCFAAVNWLKPFPERLGFVQQMSAWYAKKYFRETGASFIPFQRIASKASFVPLKHGSDELLLLCPQQFKL